MCLKLSGKVKEKMNKLKQMLKNTSGQGMVEYGLILALVSIIAIASLMAMGSSVSGQLDTIHNSMGDGLGGGSGGTGGSIGAHVGISTDADYRDWGPLEELGPIPDNAYYAGDGDFDLIEEVDYYGDKTGEYYWHYNKASDQAASDYEPVVVIPKTIQGELVTSYKYMFAEASRPTVAGTYVTAVYAADSSAVTSMEYMFSDLKSTSLLVDHMDTSNVTTMEGMFQKVGSYEDPVESITFGNLDTSNVTNMGYMFMSSNIKELDLRRLNTSNVTTMQHMFRSDKPWEDEVDMRTPLHLNITNFDTRNVEAANMMFYESAAVELDVRSFRSDSMRDISNMFQGIDIPMLDLSQFKITPDMTRNVFIEGSNIKVLDLSGMALEGTHGRDWSGVNMLGYSSVVEKAYVKTDADAVIINMTPGFYPNNYRFEGLPKR